MNERAILPPGQHPNDPSKHDIDPIGFALARLRIHLLWIDEHRHSFEKLRHCEPVRAETELNYLKDSTEQALTHLLRLIELLLTGYTIDPNKRLPMDLCQGVDRLASYLEQLRKG
jgi:hypothetical protein